MTIFISDTMTPIPAEWAITATSIRIMAVIVLWNESPSFIQTSCHTT